jgi:ACR3 family arsenite transporter
LFVREALERRQIWIYFASVIAGTFAASAIAGTEGLEPLVNPALALMLFVTFLQVPLAEVGKAFREIRFLIALMVSNFLAVPCLVLLLVSFAPNDALVRLGILMVLLTPCIDYVITFSQLGRADARLLLASTPLLLVIQMALLPFYLTAFLGDQVSGLVSLAPFLRAFIWLIMVPLAFAAVAQFWASCGPTGRRVVAWLGILPVLSTALVLFLVVAATVPLLGNAADKALGVVPIYVAFAIFAPMLGLAVGRVFRLGTAASRSVAFSSSTRNSLVVLPLALAVPGAVPVLPAVIVTQTLVELISELVYIRILPLFGRKSEAAEQSA